MMFLVLLFTAFNIVHTIQIGAIHNASLVTLSINRTMTARTCNECLCTMLNVTGTVSILSLNCHMNYSNTVNCELFSSTSYLNSPFYKIENTSKSIFYFQQLPPLIQSETTTTGASVETSEESLISTAEYPCASLRWNSTGVILAANGTGSNQVQAPQAVFVPVGSDILYIVDTNNHRIQKWKPGALNATTIAGGQGPGGNSTQLNRPTMVYVDKDENLFVTDRMNFRVQLFTNGSIFGQSIYSNKTTTPNNSIGGMFGLSVDLANNVYISEYNFHRVLKLTPNATNATLAAGNGFPGNSTNQLNIPTGIYADPTTSTLYIASQNAHCIMKWIPGALNGTPIAGVCGTPGSNETLLNKPKGLTFDKYGNMYVADGSTVNTSRVMMFCRNSMYGIPIITNGLNSPQNVAIDTDFRLYVADSGNNRVIRYDLL